MKYAYVPEKGAPLLPVVPVKLLPIGEKGSLIIDGKIDTGSSVSLIPDTVRRSLNLKPHGEVSLVGPFDRMARQFPTFWIEIEVGRHSFELEVVSSPRPQFLIGRDILNQLVLHLNGPKGVSEIED